MAKWLKTTGDARRICHTRTPAKDRNALYSKSRALDHAHRPLASSICKNGAGFDDIASRISPAFHRPAKAKPCSQVAFTNGHGLTRSECDCFESAAVLAKRYFTLGATIQVIENNFWQTSLRQTRKIIDKHYPRRGYFTI